MQDCLTCSPCQFPLYWTQVYLPDDTSFPYTQQMRMNHTMFWKYSQSLCYCYSKLINDILNNRTTPNLVRCQDEMSYRQREECLNRFYAREEYNDKMKLFAEFYKYHSDIPRWGLDIRIVTTMDEHYDKQRKIAFYNIQRMIKLENQLHPERPPKGLVGDEPPSSSNTFHTPVPSFRVLDSLSSDQIKIVDCAQQPIGESPVITQFTVAPTTPVRPQSPIDLIKDIRGLRSKNGGLDPIKQRVVTSPNQKKGLVISQIDRDFLLLKLQQQKLLNKKNSIKVTEPKKQSNRKTSQSHHLKPNTFQFNPKKLSQQNILQKSVNTLKPEKASPRGRMQTLQPPLVFQSQRLMPQKVQVPKLKIPPTRNQTSKSKSRSDKHPSHSPSSQANSRSPEYRERIKNFQETLKKHTKALLKIFKDKQITLQLLTQLKQKSKSNLRPDSRPETSRNTTSRVYSPVSNLIPARKVKSPRIKISTPVHNQQVPKLSPRAPQTTRNFAQKYLKMSEGPFRTLNMKKYAQTSRMTPVSLQKVFLGKKSSQNIDWSKYALEQVSRQMQK